MSRICFCVRDLYLSLERVMPQSFPYNLPCLLHTNPSTWPNDTSHDGKVTDATMMQLNGPQMELSIIFPQRSRWAGYWRNWVAIVGHNIVEWHLVNLYTCTSIPIPSIENVGFRPSLASGAFSFEYGCAITTLRKIHIASEPELIDGKWKYKLIAVFNVFIDVLSTDGSTGNDAWSVLKQRILGPRNYVDAT